MKFIIVYRLCNAVSRTKFSGYVYIVIGHHDNSVNPFLLSQ